MSGSPKQFNRLLNIAGQGIALSCPDNWQSLIGDRSTSKCFELVCELGTEEALYRLQKVPREPTIKELTQMKEELICLDEQRRFWWDPSALPTSVRYAGCTREDYKRAFEKLKVKWRLFFNDIHDEQIPTAPGLTRYPLDPFASVAEIVKLPKTNLKEQEVQLAQASWELCSVEEVLDHVLDVAIRGRLQDRDPNCVVSKLATVSPIRCRNSCSPTPTFSGSGGYYPAKLAVSIDVNDGINITSVIDHGDYYCLVKK